jgi:hypothetical protein
MFQNRSTFRDPEQLLPEQAGFWKISSGSAKTEQVRVELVPFHTEPIKISRNHSTFRRT